MARAFATDTTNPTTYWVALNADGDYAGATLTATTTGLEIGYVPNRDLPVVATISGTPAPVALAGAASNYLAWGFVQVNRNIYRVDMPVAFANAEGPRFPFVRIVGSAIVFRQFEPVAIIGSDPYAGAADSSAIAADVLSAATASPIAANVESINATTVLGTGITSDKWRGA